MLLFDGVFSQVMAALTGGAILVGFALSMSASNKVIGLIAAIGPLTQLLQIPAIVLVERVRRRKAVVLVVSTLGRASWLAAAAIPFVVAPELRVLALLIALCLYFSGAAIANSAYNSWKRDLVPDPVMGRYFAHRLTIATAAGALVTLGAGLFVDHGQSLFADPRHVFSPMLLLGGLAGLGGVLFLGRIPEPPMAPPESTSLVGLLTEPLRETNFRRLLMFLGSWNFAINLAAPFFSVYMLVRLHLPMTWVLGLSVVSQLANVSFFAIWGRLADRLGHKSVLGLSGSLFVASIAMWPFTTLPERYTLTVPLLLVIHALAGMSTAGVTLAAASITLKLAPRGKATAFLATNALISGVAATLAPALGGLMADGLALRRLTLQLSWSGSESHSLMFRALDLSGLDFLFVGAVVLGLYALHRLLAVEEVGEVVDGEPAVELYSEIRRAMSHISHVAGVRRLTYFPYALLRKRSGGRVGTSPQTGD